MTGGNKDYLTGDSSPSDPRAGVGGGGGGGAGPAGTDPCDITSNGTLRSPNPDIVRSLKPHERLAVEIAATGGVKVLRAIHDGASAGVIDCPAEREIIRCIEEGNIYVAAILRVQGGAVSLSVTRA
jgi:hypothetical protein